MTQAGFKGNKQALPQKDCSVCGKPMAWRKRWARNWEAVKYCSDRCRASARPAGGVDQVQKPAP